MGLAAVIVFGSLAAAAPSSAGTDLPAGLSAEDAALMREQAPYIELDTKVREIATATGADPLAGTRVDIAGHTLHVHWAGEFPAALTALRPAAAKQGINLRITRAAFSEKQLIEAARDLALFAKSNRANVTVVLHNDGSGLTVRDKGLPAAAQHRTGTQAQEALLAVIDKTRGNKGVPVSLEDRDETAVPASREEDNSPYWGGAITRSVHGKCTSGFSTYASGDTSMRHMITAAHCTGYLDGVSVGNGMNIQMGRTDFIAEMFDQYPSYDLGVIRIDAGKTNMPNIYAANGSNYRVIGYAQYGVPAGLGYCVSAAVSAPNCNITSGNQVWRCPDGVCAYYIEVYSRDGSSLVFCKGDSGGPIYYWNSSWTGIYAAGVVGYIVPMAGDPNCGRTGGISVVATAVGRLPGLRVLT